MTNDQNTAQVQDVEKELESILDEANKIGDELDAIDSEMADATARIMKDFEASAHKADELCSELDGIEREAGDEIDALLIDEAEDLAEGEE